MNKSTVLIMGGGPGGATAALTLKKLGHNVQVFEGSEFPRYKIGESFLPGTLSIWKRLGVWGKIEKQGYVSKPSATFLWGRDQAPYTFSFSTTKPHDWVFDHAIQVERGKFDQLLLKEVENRDVEVRLGARITDVDLSNPEKISITYDDDGTTRTIEGDYLIDASGTNSPLVKKLGIRKHDEFFKSIAVWSYFQLEDPFKGDLKGTTYSITFEDGWVWMIPIEKNKYSVGMIIDFSNTKKIKEMGREEFYKQTLKKCEGAMNILGDAEMVGDVRVIKDWAYDTEYFSKDRFFLVGDAACFTDPLFSQGVQLATSSAVRAASAIDYASENPNQLDACHAWYEEACRDTYEQYHQFVASYYTYASFTEVDSIFWRKRGLKETSDKQLLRKEWFKKLLDKDAKHEELLIDDFRDRASTMIAIGRHKRKHLSDDFSDDELSIARITWIGKLHKQLRRIKKFKWMGDKIELKPYFKINPTTFKLEPINLISDGNGRDMKRYPLNMDDLEFLTTLTKSNVNFSELNTYFSENGRGEVSSQIIIQLMESGLLAGYDKNDMKIHIQDRLRFNGVGSEYDV